MRAGVRRRSDGGSWAYTLELGLQAAQRCQQCGRRQWVGQRRLEACPACGGAVKATRERRQIVQGGFRTRRDAEDARDDRKRTLREGEFVMPLKLTLAEYLRDQWLPAIAGEDLKPTTLQSYKQLVENHLIGRDAAPYDIGTVQLQKLTRDAIRAHYAILAARGKANGGEGGLAPASVRRVHATLSRALNDAAVSGLFSRNPAKGVTKRLPRPAAPSTAAQKAWTAEQVGAFLEATKADRLGVLWRLYLMTGLRRGEALALRLSDFDAANGSISVSKSRVPLNKKVIETTPKSDSGQRVVQLDAETAEILRQHIANGAGDYIFTSKAGTPLDPNDVSRAFVKAVEAAKLPALSLHGARHTHASLALRAGVPAKVVQERLGHSSVALTLDIYSHVAPGMDAGAAETIANLVKTSGK